MTGSVMDGTGALIPDAAITLSAQDQQSATHTPDSTQLTDRTGTFAFHAPPGQYRLSVERPGFAPYAQTLQLASQRHVVISVKLEVAALHEEVTVPESADGADPAGIENAITFAGDTLKALSSDPTTLLQQLTALTGGMGPPRFVIDGFSGGKLPPKSSIRSITINRNPFSAYFTDFGLQRVEVTTQPGGDKFHGELDLSGTDQPFNAANPYTTVRPPFFDFQQSGNVSGPLGKGTSFFLSDNLEDLQNSSVVNAADPAAPSILLSTYAPAPQHLQTYALRIDRQFGAHNFGYLRDEWNRTTIGNSGIVPLVLPEAAFGSDVLSNALQGSDTQILGAHAVNEARFQYLRTRLAQVPNTTGPSVVVQGSLQAGGAPTQLLRDAQDLYESQDRFEMDLGHHSLRAGFRWTALRDANLSTAGFNGQYIFADVPSYEAGRAQQYSQTSGLPQAVLVDHQVAVYAEDDWKLRPNLTLSYGLRFESQSAIPDHADPAPRVGFSWAVQPHGRKTAIVTLRGGYGLFYNHFPAAELLQTIRQDGTREIAHVAMNVPYNPGGAPFGTTLTTAQPALYALQPNLRSMYAQIASLTVNRALGKRGALVFNGLYDHDTHAYLTRNSNAPLPGTYDAAVPGSGIRPLGTDANVYQYASSGNANQEILSLTYRLQVTSKLYAYGLAKYDKNLSETDGVDNFVAHPYDIRQDYGRTNVDVVRSLSAGFLWTLPRDVQAMLFVAAHSGVPFDITTGTDLNGDTIYNDRPGLGSAVASHTTVQTGYGAFDVSPVGGESILQRNAATAPGYLWTMLRLGRDFHLGPRAAAAAKGATPAEAPYVLNFSVEVHNVGNHNNPGLPVGALSAAPCGSTGTAPVPCPVTGGVLAPSAYFGRSLSLAPDFSPITASNRTVLLQTSFSF